jgi:hypothetical protein
MAERERREVLLHALTEAGRKFSKAVAATTDEEVRKAIQLLAPLSGSSDPVLLGKHGNDELNRGRC